LGTNTVEIKAAGVSFPPRYPWAVANADPLVDWEYREETAVLGKIGVRIIQKVD
jgi:hypothetical protein